ncbi:Rne/Rng family ribonuclease [uncultured Jannaschia sp.]|uniref:Rne/Rng family ribonuclease n=1 Tax=uncultured Jannaschia sp. TaxID=293347 RepID=UPI002603CBC6|nr:Rne/Rng family ribonuclease [uncultured Jannaschia sp.]
MAKKMLIDATHPEETRVVVADGNRIEEFDFESLNRRQLAGNIYLAKVTRVEPSLQAAFIDYGGNRHGFLAFSEIHPDYYQIPKADRDAILAEERAMAREEEASEEASDRKTAGSADAGEEEAQDADGPDGTEAAGDEDEQKPKKRSRSRSRSRSRKKADAADASGGTDDSDGPASPEEEPSAEVAIERRESSTSGVTSGMPAELSEAATEGEVAEDAGLRTDDADESSDAPDGDGNGDGDDDGPVRTIAESAGLEDEQVTDDGSGAAAAPSDADPRPAPKETEAQPEPAGMETVDLDEDDDPTEVSAAPSRRSRGRSKSKEPADKDSGVETVADDDTPEDIQPPRAPRPRTRKYKIQEVIKVRQIMLVQVVKEERGNKGAALTTYLSLAGRYCVLMPNTARGGGISRKITNAADRKKLKEIASEIDVPQGAGLIVRTAGAKRTKTEIKRDYEYLQRQWEQVRELTLKSIAPAPIYEEGNLIHRSIRDLYSRDIDEVIVEGEAGYREARAYMKLIMPSHAKNVKAHVGNGQPLFAKYGVESYLASMFNPTVQLKSGGYIVIGITEALVAIDVNSGKSTKEGSIEDTATKTNLEAADEVARQMRLRDLAGLIVIDFIDMDERRNNAAVEKRLKDALKNDRARIQVGRISGFGLLEMSRQRLRPGMLEATTQACPHCHGTGMIRSDDSVALSILRAVEEEGVKTRTREVLLKVPVDISNYLMNEKREHLAGIETRYDMAVRVVADPALVAPDFAMEKFKTATRVVPKISNVVGTDTSWTPEEDDDEDVVEVDAEADEDDAAQDDSAQDDTAQDDSAQDDNREEARTEGRDDDRPNGEGPSKKKRRRRSRRKKSGQNDDMSGSESDTAATSSGSDEGQAPIEGEAQPEARNADTTAEAGDATNAETGPAAEAPVEDAPPKPRSRSRSRSRTKKAPEAEVATDADRIEDAPATDPVTMTEAEADAPDDATPEAPAKPKSRTRARAKAPAPSEPVADAAATVEAIDFAPPAAAETTEDDTPSPDGEPASAAEDVAVPAPDVDATPGPDEDATREPSAEIQTEETAKPKRRGWWSFGG